MLLHGRVLPIPHKGIDDSLVVKFLESTYPMAHCLDGCVVFWMDTHFVTTDVQDVEALETRDEKKLLWP
jgi:hypothetical protein